jgi:four helix bundle protein
MHHIEQLKVWKLSMEIAKDVYVITKDFPSEEKFGLTAQVRRAAVSIASNIAEGAGRYSDKEFAHFLSIASGSSFEVRTQLLLSEQLGFTTTETLISILNNLSELECMIQGLRKSLKTT